MDGPEERLIEFEKVKGQLTVPGAPECLMTTCAEIRRRTEAPENMGLSQLCLVLKRKKTKQGTDEVRDVLDENNIPIRTRSSETESCSITSITETEMTSIAQDLEVIAEDDYPTTAIAAAAIEEEGGDEEKLKKLAEDAEGFLTVMNHLGPLLENCQPDLNRIRKRQLKDPDLNDEMDRFSKATHGFGPFSQRTFANLAMEIAHQMTGQMENRGSSNDHEVPLLDDDEANIDIER